VSALTLLAAPLVVAGVLAVSGVAKLGDVSEGVRGLRELQVPDWLVRDGVARAHPIAEIVIGLGLVLLPTPWRTAAAVAALGLLAAYTVLVLAALRRAREVRCNCFGRRSEVVNRATAVRNLALLALARRRARGLRGGVGAGGAGVQRAGPVGVDRDPRRHRRGGLVDRPRVCRSGTCRGGGRPGGCGRGSWRVVRREGGGGRVRTSADEWVEDEGRLPIPAETLRSADGTTTTLAELVTERAAVLLFLEPTCGSCARLLNDLSAWRRVMPEIRIVTVRAVPDPAAHLVHRHGPPPTDGTGEPFPTSPGGYWAEASITGSFGTNGFTPWAVLLGADGLVAGGPVAGSVAVRAFLAEVLTHLAGGA
jgi:hypothetical protein